MALGVSPAHADDAPVPTYRQASRVVVITIEGEIDKWMYESVKRRMAVAEHNGADALVFEINSPGGEVLVVNALCELIKQGPIQNTVAWVNNEAYSGGAIVALACREIVMNAAAQMGDAMPVAVDPILSRLGTVDTKELQRKILPPLLANVLDSARRHNEFFHRYQRDEFLVQSIILNDLSLWWVEDTRSGQRMAIDRREFEMLFPGVSPDGPAALASGTAPAASGSLSAPGKSGDGVNLPGGSEKLSGVSTEQVAQQASAPLASLRPKLTEADRGRWTLIDRVTNGSVAAMFTTPDAVRYGLAANATTKDAGGNVAVVPIRNDEDLRAFFGAKHIVRLNATWSEGLVGFLTHPICKGVLLVIFFVALFVEMTHPGVTLPGVVAVVALVLLLGPPLLIGMAAWWMAAAIVLGMALLALEVFVIPGFGVTGVLGMLLLFAGLVGVFLGGGSLFPDSEHEQRRLLWNMSTFLGALFTAGVTIYYVAKNITSLPMLNRLVLREASGDEGPSSILQAMEEPASPVRVGDAGVAVTPLRPAGKVQVGDQVLDAVAEFGFLPLGAKIRVTSVTPFRLGVEGVG